MLRLLVLGELTIDVGGETAALPASWRARSVLGWLALHPGLHRRGALAARFWPDILDASARASLRNALWSLRRALGPDADAWLISTREHVGLADGVWTDAAAFAEHVRAGRDEDALALSRGDLLAGIQDDWVLEAREEHRGAVGALLERLADRAHEAGDDERALALARRWTAIDPLSEAAHRSVMRRLSDAGDPAAALAAYRRLADRLRADYRTAPSAQTRALADELRNGEPGVAVPASPVAAPAVALAERLATPPPTPFVGRRPELDRLRAVCAAASTAGAPVLALVTGEAGIGKSRLVREIAVEAARGGATVLHGVCAPEAVEPFEPFVEALRAARALPDADPEGGALVARLRALAADAPVVLALDDVHAVDPSSARLLGHLLRAGPPRLLVLGTARPGELAPDHPLAEVLGRQALERVELEGLGRGDVARLARDRLGSDAEGVAGDLYERSEGNPLFALELLRAHETGDRRAGLPATVADVIGARVSRLPAEAAHLLETAAALGREFELEMLERLVEAEGEAFLAHVDLALSARLVDEVPGGTERLAFTHALVREALLARVSGPRRRRLHCRAAAVLRELHAGDLDAGAPHITRHLCEAGPAADPHELVSMTIRAGARAASQRAFDEEIACYTRALGVLPPSEEARRRMLTLRRAIAFTALMHIVMDAPQLQT